MRTLLKTLAVVLVFTLGVNAQTVSYEDLYNAGKKPKGTFTTYVTSLEERISIGDTLTLGNTYEEGFRHVYLFDGFEAKLAYDVDKNRKSVVTKFKITGSRTRGFLMTIYGEARLNRSYIVVYEKALKTKEVLTNK